MGREKADLMAGLYRLSAASFDYCSPSLPNNVPAFHASFFNFTQTSGVFPELPGAEPHADHRLWRRGAGMWEKSFNARALENI
jgi:hypothetical protein